MAAIILMLQDLCPMSLTYNRICKCLFIISGLDEKYTISFKKLSFQLACRYLAKCFLHSKWLRTRYIGKSATQPDLAS